MLLENIKSYQSLNTTKTKTPTSKSQWNNSSFLKVAFRRGAVDLKTKLISSLSFSKHQQQAIQSKAKSCSTVTLLSAFAWRHKRNRRERWSYVLMESFRKACFVFVVSLPNYQCDANFVHEILFTILLLGAGFSVPNNF